MYHISNDLRAKKSADKIGIGLLKCLNYKSFVEITVTDVQKTSSVGRATFYRLFDNITDVLSYLCDSVFEKVGLEFKTITNFNQKESLLKFIQEWMNNKALLKAIVDSNRIDILYVSHTKYIGNNLDYFFPGLSINIEQTNYLLMTMTSCISAFLTAWIKNGGYESAEQLQKQLFDCFKILSNIFNS